MKRLLFIPFVLLGCSQAPVLRDSDMIRAQIITPDVWEAGTSPTVQFQAMRIRGPQERHLLASEGLYLGEISLAVTFQGEEPFESRTKVYLFKADC